MAGASEYDEPTRAFYRSLPDAWLVQLRDAFEADLRIDQHKGNARFCEHRIAIIDEVINDRAGVVQG